MELVSFLLLSVLCLLTASLHQKESLQVLDSVGRERQFTSTHFPKYLNLPIKQLEGTQSAYVATASSPYTRT